MSFCKEFPDYFRQESFFSTHLRVLDCAFFITEAGVADSEEVTYAGPIERGR